MRGQELKRKAMHALSNPIKYLEINESQIFGVKRIAYYHDSTRRLVGPRVYIILIVSRTKTVWK